MESESDTFSIALQPNPKVPWCIGAQRPLQIGLSEISNVSYNSDIFNQTSIVDRILKSRINTS